MRISVAEVEALAERAHAGQVDRGGVPYIEHVRAVGWALEPFGDETQMAGLLHDVLEDTSLTEDDLRAARVPETAISSVKAVTRPSEADDPQRPTYQQWIEQLSVRERYGAGDLISPTVLMGLGIDPLTRVARPVLLKLADNAHNSRGDRQTPGVDMSRRYSRARATLLAALDPQAARIVLERVNPDLLVELSH